MHPWLAYISGDVLPFLSCRIPRGARSFARLAGLADVAASDRRRLGHRDSPSARIRNARSLARRRIFHSAHFRHEVSLYDAHRWRRNTHWLAGRAEVPRGGRALANAGMVPDRKRRSWARRTLFRYLDRTRAAL